MGAAPRVDGVLSEEDWSFVQATVPIPCVDLLPVRLCSEGRVERVGLVKRATPFDHAARWCHLGGRIRRNETIRAAVLRHLDETLIGARAEIPMDAQPDYVMQWFPQARSDFDVAYGLDPRKHAVSLGFAVPTTGDPEAKPGGEACEFRWFDVGELKRLAVPIWPGVLEFVWSVLGRFGPAAADQYTSARAFGAITADTNAVAPAMVIPEIKSEAPM